MDLIYDLKVVDASQSVAVAGTLASIGATCQLNRSALRQMGVKADDVDGVRLTAQLYSLTSPGGVPTLSAIGNPERLIHTGGGSYVVGIAAPTVAAGATFNGIIKVGLAYPIELPEGNAYGKSAVSESDVGTKTHPVRFFRAAS